MMEGTRLKFEFTFVFVALYVRIVEHGISLNPRIHRFLLMNSTCKGMAQGG